MDTVYAFLKSIFVLCVIFLTGCSMCIQKCSWLPWQPWESCSQTCGGGHQRRVRSVCCPFRTKLAECMVKCNLKEEESFEDRCCNVICYNGGMVCMDNLSSSASCSKFCKCLDGFSGTCCTTNINDCWSSPCLHGGTCIDSLSSYRCSCPPGYTGQHCQTEHDECVSSPCSSYGICRDFLNYYVCDCAQGYTGLHCQEIG
ncbi:hypothetical protein CHS0354_029218 [Potamilus streckersoni]|uniref:EGF-like domain-containing protein n=1 Tax=Potamilus streckersoni TaxID=2493646 RepID=A0AAE0SV33_9BIVA|nr:hypothetical protein CHS0354_029218 [Potamilus streckersoni]